MSVSKNPHRLSYQSTCDCAIDRAIRLGNNHIFITGAQKQLDRPTGKSYITYHIRVGINKDIETEHRYSEFESLQKALFRLHPVLIVPPIPEKHSLIDYAALQTRVRDDWCRIEKRKRMLQTFLNRVARHPELGRHHVFHEFLDSTKRWANVLRSPPLSTLPKNLLMMILARQPDGQIKVLPEQCLPPITSSYNVKCPDMRFEQTEVMAFKVAHYMGHTLERSHSRVMRRLGEQSMEDSVLGDVYNGLGANETEPVSRAITKIGRAVDTCYTETTHMVTLLEGELALQTQEHTQLAHSVKQVLRFRHQKQAQMELIEASLTSQQQTLDHLQRKEEESRRLQHVLTVEQQVVHEPSSSETQEDSVSPEDFYSPILQRHKLRSPRKWSGRPFQFFNTVGNTLHHMMEVDHEEARQDQLDRTKEMMEKLQEALVLARMDLTDASNRLEADVVRYQQQKARDLRDMLLVYAKTHVRYCQKNMEAWQEAQTQAETLPYDTL
ncbi:hypothetical protein BDF14DRAFT_1822542 [Spinellus fusiger]|nr:hypothetical protein BDF14DRAFT_1822542 [Spinellus fusiger]